MSPLVESFAGDSASSLKANNIPPSVTTTNASPITTYDALLSGNVNPNYVGAGITSYYFQIGTSSQNYNTNSNFGAGTVSYGRTNIPVSVTATLSAGVTYYWRIVATGPGGTTNSPESSFTMTPAVSVYQTFYSSYNNNNTAQQNGNGIVGARQRLITVPSAPGSGMLIAKVCLPAPNNGVVVSDPSYGNWTQNVSANGGGASSGYAGIFSRPYSAGQINNLVITADNGAIAISPYYENSDILLVVQILQNANYCSTTAVNPSGNDWWFAFPSNRAGALIAGAICSWKSGWSGGAAASYSLQNYSNFDDSNYFNDYASPTGSSSDNALGSSVSGARMTDASNGDYFIGFTQSTPSNVSPSSINVGVDTGGEFAAFPGAADRMVWAEFSSYYLQTL